MRLHAAAAEPISLVEPKKSAVLEATLRLRRHGGRIADFASVGHKKEPTSQVGVSKKRATRSATRATYLLWPPARVSREGDKQKALHRTSARFRSDALGHPDQGLVHRDHRQRKLDFGNQDDVGNSQCHREVPYLTDFPCSLSRMYFASTIVFVCLETKSFIVYRLASRSPGLSGTRSCIHGRSIM